jgi:plastocyanin
MPCTGERAGADEDVVNCRLLLVALAIPVTGLGQVTLEPSAHSHHQMQVDASGVVMNENRSTLPRDCPEISRDYQFTIHAGQKYAAAQPGLIFGMSPHEVRVEPCSRLEITFVNEDDVRHQWMVHGLPKYLYPAGMFHIEVTGGQQKSGTLIVPGGDHTYLVHCDLAQHMEKGMRGQLVVGHGSGNLWGIPAISDDFYRSSYLPEKTLLFAGLAWIIGLLIAIFVMTCVMTWIYRGNTPS